MIWFDLGPRLRIIKQMIAGEAFSDQQQCGPFVS